MSVSLGAFPLWYKIAHPAFDKERAYRALAYIPYGETAWAYLVFVTEKGHTYQVQVWRCTCLPVIDETLDYNMRALHRPLTLAEHAFPWATKPATPNPDLATDI